MKEFYLINRIEATSKDFQDEGYTVINFSQVRDKIKDILGDKETAEKYHLYNYPFTQHDERLNEIHHKLEKLAFKEARGNSHKMAIGWENGNSYLRYHSGIIYKWFS